MNPLKNFDEYIKEGVLKIKTPDKLRSKDLMKEAEKLYNSLIEIVEKISIHDTNASHIIKNSYDVIMELIISHIMLEGYTEVGYGAHEAEVSYTRKLIDEEDVQSLNQLRYFRNGITYYGQTSNKEYTEKVLNFLKRIYKKLKGLITTADK